MKLLLATRNVGKVREIKKMLAGHGFEIIDLQALDNPPQVVEDGDSFVANARKKALEIAAFADCLTLADDSGLVVPALGGAPGVYSARYAGEDASDQQNNRRLLTELAALPKAQHQAYFCCTMALADPQGRCRTFDGRLDGKLLLELRGEQGFGYDPLFLVPEYAKTLAELSLEIKNRISHRAKALSQVLAALAADDLWQA